MAVTDPQSTNPMPVAGHDGTNFRAVKTDTSGRLVVGGDVADDAAASGNPTPVGGIYNTTQPTYTNLDRTQLQFTARGELLVTTSTGASAQTMGSAAGDAVTNSVNATWVYGRTYRYNGTTWDREYGNADVTALASAARTVTLNSGDLTNYNGRGLHVVLDVTNAGTGSITITIQGKDALSGQYYTLLAGAAVTTVSTNVYKVYPGLTAAANAVASDILPRTYRILVTHNNANSITYSVGASVIQ